MFGESHVAMQCNPVMPCGHAVQCNFPSIKRLESKSLWFQDLLQANSEPFRVHNASRVSTKPKRVTYCRRKASEATRRACKSRIGLALETSPSCNTKRVRMEDIQGSC